MAFSVKMKRIRALKNEQCILVEFVNESDSLAVGYQCWLEKQVTQEELKELIDQKSIVQIQWPKCDIKSAQHMKTILNNLSESDWDNIAARILSAGEWTKMHDEMMSVEKYNEPNPSKKQRKALMTRSSENRAENKAITKQATTSTKKANKRSLKKKGTASEKRTADVLEDLMADKNIAHEGDWDISTEDSNASDYEPLPKRSKANLEDDVRVLKFNNHKLKEEIKNYKSMIETSKFLPEVQQEMETLLSGLRDANKLVSKISFVCTACKKTFKSTSAAASASLVRKGATSATSESPLNINATIFAPSSIDIEATAVGKTGEKTGHNIDIISQESTTKKPSLLPFSTNVMVSIPSSIDRLVDYGSPKKCSEATNGGDQSVISDDLESEFPAFGQTFADHEKRVEPETEDDEPFEFLPISPSNTQPRVVVEKGNETTAKTTTPAIVIGGEQVADEGIMVDLGHGVKIHETILKSCLATDVSKLTNHLLRCLFQPQDFANCSSSGKKGKQKSNEEKKPRLDPSKVEAITDYVKKKFSLQSSEEVEKKIKTIIQNKCKNMSKTHGKK